jgi:hypothetical protein
VITRRKPIDSQLLPEHSDSPILEKTISRTINDMEILLQEDRSGGSLAGIVNIHTNSTWVFVGEYS